ncbi:glycerophosphodiester phosphodiesterase [bacterium]|nr:glycerophosphodiester phosphodiesterase [bacterium]
MANHTAPSFWNRPSVLLAVNLVSRYLACMISFHSLQQQTPPLVIAHRGASEQAHENTREAFELAIAMEADAIECDIRRTACGELIVHHDPAVLGFTRPIALLDLAEVRRQATSAGYSIMTLAETVELCAGRIAMDVELKEPGYEERVVAAVRERFSSDTVLFKSFHDRSVARLHRIDPALHAGLLIGAPRTVALRSRPKDISLERRLTQCGATFVAPHWARLRFGFVRKMNAMGLPIIVWTVDRPAMARLLARKHVAGIVTNVPDRILPVVSS